MAHVDHNFMVKKELPGTLNNVGAILILRTLSSKVDVITIKEIFRTSSGLCR